MLLKGEFVMGLKVAGLIVVSFVFFLQWRETQVALKDLDFMQQTLLKHHPGPYNKDDPDFKKHASLLYKQAYNDLLKYSLTWKQKQILTDYAKGFSDVHLWIHWFGNQSKGSSQNVYHKPFSASVISNNILWITVPTFMLLAAAQKEFKDFLRDVAGKLKDDQIIVFDLRGNQGGNSQYGSELIDVVFGEDCVEPKRRKYWSEVSVDWRVTQENVEHLESLAKQHSMDWLDKMALKMRGALSRGLDLLHTENDPYVEASLKADCRKNKVFVVIDSDNVSAALDFIDEVKLAAPQATLVGQETKGDSLYMEVRGVELPSKLGELWFPIKVYKNRARKNKETYKPDITCNSKDTQQLLKIIQNYR